MNNELEINNIQLTGLHVSVKKELEKCDFTNMQAMMKIEFDFDSEINKKITYRIVVGTGVGTDFYHVKCDFRFTSNGEYEDPFLIDQVTILLEPRINEILGFINNEVVGLNNMYQQEIPEQNGRVH